MSTRSFCWLIAALAVVAATFALAGLIVVFAPNDPSTATAAAQQQVIERKLESIVESHRGAR